jgi:hypothetical protein
LFQIGVSSSSTPRSPAGECTFIEDVIVFWSFLPDVTW